MSRRILQHAAKVLATLFLTALISLTGLLAWLGFDHTRETLLPAPTGPSQVGRVLYDWTDATRPNPYAPQAHTPQELAVWIWYPAAVTPASQPADYLPPYWRTALERHEGLLLTRFLSRDLSRVHTHSWSNAAMAPHPATYPIILLRAGGGALSSDYTSLAEDLASHGYVVVSMDAPYRTVITAFPDGRVMERTAQGDFDNLPYAEAEKTATQLMNIWVQDEKFVLQRLQALNASDPSGRFRGKLDLQRVGIVGHSLGGATAAQFCHDDTRCKAGIDVDGIPFGSVVQDSLSQPFFFLLSDHRKEHGPEAPLVESKIQAIYSKLPAGTRRQAMIDGANHFTFSDQMFTKSPILLRVLQFAGVMGPLDKHRGLEIARACLTTFFDVYLNDAPAARLTGLPSQYPELHPDLTRAFPRNP